MKSVPWACQSEQFQDYMRQLRFRFKKWDGYVEGQLRLIPESIVLSQDEHATIVGLAERLAATLRTLENRVFKDLDSLRQLGIPDSVARWMQQEPESPWQLARYDFFRMPNGSWVVCEFNEDVPGGYNEIIAAPLLLPAFHPGFRFVDRFAEAFMEAVPASGAVALMYATGYAEDLQHMVVLQDVLARRGQTGILCSPRHLRSGWRGFSVDGCRVESVVRFYPGEWFPLLENQRDWQRAIGSLPMLNPLRRLISQSKAVFALWERDGLVSDQDREFLRSVAPRSWMMEDVAARLDFRQQLESFPEQWVLKQQFGRMGENVIMGSLSRSADWLNAVTEAWKKPAQFIAQQCFSVAPLAFSNGPLFPAIGAFVINGRFAGYYSRVAKQPFLTHQATYVPTVIDDR